jgi:zinc protease
MTRLRSLLAVASFSTAAALASPAFAALPPEREDPPAPLPARPVPEPAQTVTALANGLAVSTLPVGSLPVVELRLVVRGGNGEGKNPALAALTAELLKDGGTKRFGPSLLLERIEALGADLHVDVGVDVTTFSVSTTRSRWAEALDLLALVVREPLFDAGEFKKIRARMVDEARARALSSGRYIASQALARELYAPGSRYGVFGLRAADLEKASLEDCIGYWRAHVTPSNARLFVAGRVTAEESAPVVAKHFASWVDRPSEKAPPVTTTPPKATRVVLLDKPGSQSDVYLARFTEPRGKGSWPSLELAIGVLGGGETSRLFTEVRETKSLAYATAARVYAREAGPVPFALYAGTKTESTREVVGELLAQAEKLRSEGFRAGELDEMRRYLRDSDLVLLETVGDVVGEAVSEWRLGLPAGTFARERAALGTVPEGDVRALMNEAFAGPFLVVVAGDAARIADDLRSFGAVTVVDPQTGLTKATLEKQPSP